MIKDLIYELSVSEQSETGALGIALTCSRALSLSSRAEQP